ncbi:MAG: ABC transporter permease [Phycisphaerales bacterium JB040]
MPVILRWFLRLGPLNPIAVRLVENGSRRTKHMYVRSAYLAVLILVLLWSLVVKASEDEMGYRELAAAGASSFIGIAYLQIGLICVIAPVFMAGAIASESNPKTWDILLTTPMSQAEIVLGNLFGRLFFILALLFCSLPLFALTQFFGGVPGGSIFTSYLIAACAATLVGAIAIALSVSRLAGRRAVFAFYISVVTYLAATWAVDRFMVGAGMGAGPAGDGVTIVTAVNPFLALHALLNPASYPRATDGSLSGLGAFLLETPVTAWCVLSLAGSLLLMGASTFTVRAGGLATLAQTTSGVPWYRRMFGLGAANAIERPPREVWRNPIAWREAAARNATLGKILARWAFVGAGLLLAVAIVVLFDSDPTIPTSTFRFLVQAVVWTEVTVIALVAINMAASAVSREREDGTLDLILTTPITPGVYLTGKLRGLVAYLLPMIAVPVFTIGLAGLYALTDGLQRTGGIGVTTATPGGPSISTPAVLPESILLAPLVLIPFVAFCVMVGLQWSLKSKGSLSAVIATVAIVGVVSGTIGLCAWNAGASLPGLGPSLVPLSPASLVGALVSPETSMYETVTGSTGGLTAARIALAIGAAISAGLYIAIVYGIHASVTKNFDMTVRKLAGTS